MDRVAERLAEDGMLGFEAQLGPAQRVGEVPGPVRLRFRVRAEAALDRLEEPGELGPVLVAVLGAFDGGGELVE